MDPAALKEAGGWAAFAVMFAVWLRTMESHRRQEQRQERDIEAWREVANEVIKSADASYGKRRRQDQLAAEALAQTRGGGDRRFDRRLAHALARRAKGES